MTAAKNLAYRMLNLRISTGFTQEDEAGRLGISRAALSHYEKARRQPDYETLVAFADLHNVTIDYLFGREDGQMSGKPVNEYLTLEPTTDECVAPECGALIGPEDAYYKVAGNICCSFGCAEKVRKEIKIERFTI